MKSMQMVADWPRNQLYFEVHRVDLHDWKKRKIVKNEKKDKHFHEFFGEIKK